MIRLMHFSTATSHLSKAEIADFVAEAQQRYAEHGVTGMLSFNGRNFCEVLEGDEQTVRSLVDTIRTDQRHAGFKVLDERPITERRFKDWHLKRVQSLDFSEAVSAMDA